MNRGLALTATTLLGLYLRANYSLPEQIALLCRVSWILITASILAALFLPELGIMADGHAGAWRGVFVQKNAMGRYMTLAAIAFAVGSAAGGRHARTHLLGLLTALSLIALTRSATSLLVATMLLASLPVLSALRLRLRIVLPILVTIASVAFASLLWLQVNAEALLSSIGRDPTLTGRTILWSAAIDAVSNRPWLGYGYDAFWRGASSTAGYVWSVTGWEPMQAHNGFLEVLLQLGIVGTATSIIALAVSLVRAIRQARAGDSFHRTWPLAFLVYWLLVNATESALLSHNNITWVVFAMIFAGAVRPNNVADGHHKHGPVLGLT